MDGSPTGTRATRHYRLVPHQEKPDVPVGISLNVPILREAVLPADHAALLDLLRTALDLEP
ncbi:hypothetical protein [Streptomyces sp. AK02-04a]|uniref:hypothetical protein n=1 Tax=Streptomyces sp. AK02-04a TaxID=3028649 RepID=UPI0029CA4B82|nr:hypothetical protein [Streptomyces sp. AK02-04a]